MPHHRTNSMHLFMLSREPLLTAIIWLPRETSQIQGIRRRRLRRRKGRHRRVSGPGRCFGQTVAEVGGCRLSTQWPGGSIAVFRHRAAQQRRTLRSTLVAPESPPKSWEQRTSDRECRKAAPHEGGERGFVRVRAPSVRAPQKVPSKQGQPFSVSFVADLRTTPGSLPVSKDGSSPLGQHKY